jgi:hypothetical protein
VVVKFALRLPTVASTRRLLNGGYAVFVDIALRNACNVSAGSHSAALRRPGAVDTQIRGRRGPSAKAPSRQRGRAVVLGLVGVMLMRRLSRTPSHPFRPTMDAPASANAYVSPEAHHRKLSQQQSPIGDDDQDNWSGDASSADEANRSQSGSSKRKRPLSVSCETCKQRKVKCDRGQPSCGWCLKNHSPCTYLPRKKPGLRAGYGRELEARLGESSSLDVTHWPSRGRLQMDMRGRADVSSANAIGIWRRRQSPPVRQTLLQATC